MAAASRLRSAPAHRSAIVILAAVLALNQADRGSVGALGPTLEHVFGITHFGLGLLAGAFSVVSAIATVPIGVVTDRVRRVRLLAGSVALWTVAMVVGGFAISFAMLLISRMFLGIVTATGDTTIVSLTGDLFPRRDRARALGLIQAGEFVGVGAGFLIVGAVVSVLSWRWVYWLLGALGFVLAVVLTRLPEPERGEADSEAEPRTDAVVREVVEQRIEPDPDAVVDDVDALSTPQAMLATLDVKTNRTIIVASTVGYLFSSGITLFAVVFATAQYSISNSTAALLLPIVGVGAVAGLVGGGRLADGLTRRGIASGRIIVAIVGFIVASVAFIPALLTHSLVIALPAITVGAAGMAAPNPPLDAVRLDVVVPQLWGRAQSVRTLARIVAEAAGPIALGALADHLGGGGVRGVQLTLLLLLPALAANGVLLVFATRTYPHDVAAELESARRQRRGGRPDSHARP